MLKKDSKGKLAEVNPLRTRKNSVYQKGTNNIFRISRSKLSTFIECKRCFYLDRVMGLKEPSMPGWSLNSAVDDLLKKEFDFYRKLKKPHPIMIENSLNFIPFDHVEMDKWRDSLKGGISYLDKDTNLEIYGGVDDIWFDINKEELVIVDYKAQSSTALLETESYLNSPYHEGYKIQMNIYVYILRQMGFKVSDRVFFMVCNAEKSYEKFDNKLNFTTKLIPYFTDTSKIKNTIFQMKETLESKIIPDLNKSCEKCMYLNTGKTLI